MTDSQITQSEYPELTAVITDWQTYPGNAEMEACVGLPTEPELRHSNIAETVRNHDSQGIGLDAHVRCVPSNPYTDGFLLVVEATVFAERIEATTSMGAAEDCLGELFGHVVPQAILDDDDRAKPGAWS